MKWIRLMSFCAALGAAITAHTAKRIVRPVGERQQSQQPNHAIQQGSRQVIGITYSFDPERDEWGHQLEED